ncbi:MAG: AraC family transcriptional regulator [Lachnospiraceae bacterium]|nr:AraC family transcriptional regulator [Lachnospiraceae bacterium]
MILLDIVPEDAAVFCVGSRLQVKKIVHSCDNPNWFFSFHSHSDQTELIYIAGGSGTYTWENIPYQVKTGDLVVFNSGGIHAIASDFQNPLDAWTCGVSGFMLPGLPENHILPDNMVPVLQAGETAPVFQSCMEEIFRQRQAQTANAYPVIRSLAESMVLLAWQKIHTQMRERGKSRSGFAENILRYIDQHYAEPMNMEELSRIFHMSSSHISHEMTATFHISPIQYQIRRRISEAQWELISTNRTVREIAEHVGYENTNHFSQLFMKYTGLKPLEFREKYAADPE